MRILLVLALAVVPVVAQSPVVRLINATRPASTDFQIGDRFEIVITSTANQPISVRMTMQGRTDWGPIIGWTDLKGQWSTTGQFQKSDFGDWREVWTVGGKLANPDIHFFVTAPCLKGGQALVNVDGLATAMTCDTAQGTQSFSTPNDADPFVTPDGRLVAGRMRSDMTAEQYHAEIMQSLITSRSNGRRSGRLGDEAGDLIIKIIGANALNRDETQSVLSIIHAAFETPDRIPQAAKNPFRTLNLLRNLADSATEESLKQQIAGTMTYIQAQ
jgi:hypothetical protein